MTGKQDHTHVLSGDAGIKFAADVAAGLRDAIEGHQAIEVDTQTLTTADITTVQSLLAARASAEAQGRTLTLTAPLGPPLHAVLADAGFLSPTQPHRDFWAPLPISLKDVTA